MSLLTTAPDAAAVRSGPDADGTRAGRLRRRLRRAAGWLLTGLAGLLVLFALVAPGTRLGPLTLARIPLEGLLGAALLLAAPVRARRPLVLLVGVPLGVLTVLKAIDLGFYAVLDRPFNPVLDWIMFGSTFDLVAGSLGRGGAIGVAVAAALLAVVVPVLTVLSVRRLTGVVGRHPTGTRRVTALLTVAWVGCAVFDAHLVGGVPVASDEAATRTYHRAFEVRDGLRDQREFTTELAVDGYRDAPADRLLTALGGKDVVFAFVESYGRSAVEKPEFAGQVGALLDDGTRRLDAAGFGSRSGWLTSPTAGGGSWLAHATLLSGLWIDNQQRYNRLMTTDRLTLPRVFGRSGWQTAAVMPGTNKDWPQGAFYEYHEIYDARSLGYRGRPFSWISSMPDQYTLAAFERAERASPARYPVMAEIDLTSSHEPWVPVPRLVGWDDIGDGTVFSAMAGEGDPPNVVWRDKNRIRTEYRRSIEYTLDSLVSYVQRYGDDRLVLVFLGDHQPAPLITGAGASRDVPITVVTRDRAVLDRIAGWGWQPGLKPGPQAPVWRMDAFRDRFLAAFSG